MFKSVFKYLLLTFKTKKKNKSKNLKQKPHLTKNKQTKNPTETKDETQNKK